MEQKTSEFDKVLGAWDILVIAFGAMIGWGWVVSSGNWIESGGVLGAAIAFAIGGIMIFFVGLTYAELTAAMPQWTPLKKSLFCINQYNIKCFYLFESTI